MAIPKKKVEPSILIKIKKYRINKWILNIRLIVSHL